MDQNHEGDKEQSVKDIMRRPIKALSIDTIERAFAKALTELTQQQYDVDIKQFNLQPDGAAWHSDESTMHLRISKKVVLGAGPF